MAADKLPAGAVGMNLIEIMPFPAFNPMNWGALTPRRAALAGLKSFQMNLQAYRCAYDAWRALVREQQDHYLGMLTGELSAPPASLADKNVGDQAAKEIAALSPLSLLDSYCTLSHEFLEGQHDALFKMTHRN